MEDSLSIDIEYLCEELALQMIKYQAQKIVGVDDFVSRPRRNIEINAIQEAYNIWNSICVETAELTDQKMLILSVRDLGRLYLLNMDLQPEQFNHLQGYLRKKYGITLKAKEYGEPRQEPPSYKPIAYTDEAWEHFGPAVIDLLDSDKEPVNSEILEDLFLG